jgi:hypothetical protein
MGLEQVLGKYEYFLNDEDALIYIGASGVETYKDTIDFVLSPDEINEFLQKAKDFDAGQWKYKDTTGMYVTRLMQNTLNAGDNFLSLVVPMKIDCLGFGLKLNKEAAFIDIIGDLGDSCFTNSYGCFVDVMGNVKNQFARCAKDSRFRVTGNAGYGSAGYSGRCTYEFGTSVQRGFDCAKHNEFRAFTPEGLSTLKKYVPSGNLIVYTHEGKTTHVRRMRDKYPFLEKFMGRR